MWETENICTHGGTRTPNLRFRRPTPYPLGHAGSGHQRSEKSKCAQIYCASPGNRTRVARMGILHDTTTPAAHCMGLSVIELKNTKMESNWHLAIEPKIDLPPAQCSGKSIVSGNLIFSFVRTQKCGTLHDFACHPCAGAMLIFSVSFQL